MYTSRMFIIDVAVIVFAIWLSPTIAQQADMRTEYASAICLMPAIILRVAMMVRVYFARNGYGILSMRAIVGHGLEDDVSSRKRMDQFRHEFSREYNNTIEQRVLEEDNKLKAIMKYTQDTFLHLNFNSDEVFQIRECVNFFVTNGKPLSSTEVRIKKRSNVKQSDLKNFCWNIAFQYNIGGDATADFVAETFSEWFANCTRETIRKTLRNTSGRRKIEINEHIV